MRDAFAAFHPGVNAAYFALILAVTVTTFHPILLLTALVCGLGWAALLGGRWHGATLLILFLSATVLNPLFSHAGVTVLWYFPSGNPLTLESILYGMGAGGMLITAAVWLGCMARVMTADKWMCLLGRTAPALSLLLSMTLRLLTKTKTRFKSISLAQRQVGQGGQGLLAKARQGVRLLSILITWSLEDGVITADAMDSRGYGLPGRTSYTNYRLDGRDKNALLLLACAGSYLLLMATRGALAWRYYPTIKWGGLDAWSLSAFFVWAGLCALPLLLHWKEAQEWKGMNSQI